MVLALAGVYTSISLKIDRLRLIYMYQFINQADFAAFDKENE